METRAQQAEKVARFFAEDAADEEPALQTMCRIFLKKMAGHSGEHKLVSAMLGHAVDEYARRGSKRVRDRSAYSKEPTTSGQTAENFIFGDACVPWAVMTGLDPEFIRAVAEGLRTYYTTRAHKKYKKRGNSGGRTRSKRRGKTNLKTA